MQISFKQSLTSSGFPWITSVSYSIPEYLPKLLKYASDHPEKKFMRKSKRHGNNRKVTPDEFANVDESSFIEEIIGPPFVINGHKFDLSLHVIITSVDPLRYFFLNIQKSILNLSLGSMFKMDSWSALCTQTERMCSSLQQL